MKILIWYVTDFKYELFFAETYTKIDFLQDNIYTKAEVYNG